MWKQVLCALFQLSLARASYSFHHSGDAEDEPGVAYLSEIQTSILNRDFPSSLHFRLKRDDSTDVDLILSSNDRDNENANVYLINKNSDGQYSLDKQHLGKERSVRYYQDRANAGSFAVMCDSGSGLPCKRTLSGSLYIDGEPYTLSPDDVMSRDTDEKSGARYVIKKSFVANITNSPPVTIPETTDRRRDTHLWNTHYLTPGLKPYGVELLVVGDYKLYLRFNEMVYRIAQAKLGLTGDDYEPGMGDLIITLQQIRFFFSHVVNGVDLRFGNVGDADFSIYVKLAGILIANTPELSEWTSSRAENGSKYGSTLEAVDSGEALKDFRDWFQKAENMEGMEDADHGMLLTGYNIVSGSSGGTLGISYMKGTCGSWRTSLIESHGNLMQTIETATHELGHSLGARHDGDKNDCESTDQYVMATYVGHRPEEIRLNPWRWSNCSIQYFREFLENLEDRTSNCLKDEAVPGNAIEFFYHTSRLPGQIYTLHEQCQLIFGDDSEPCFDEFKLEEICYDLRCSTDTDTCTRLLAQRGTSCGDQRWCVDGVCRFDEYAPTMY